MQIIQIGGAILTIIIVLVAFWPGKLPSAGLAKGKAPGSIKPMSQERSSAVAERPNDRVSNIRIDNGAFEPKIHFILNGLNYSRPSFEAYFADSNGDTASSNAVATTCSCDQVCTCDPQCSCQSNCTCDSQGGGGYCSCNEVCTCVPVG